MNPFAARIYAIVLLPVAVAIGVFFFLRNDRAEEYAPDMPAGPSVEVGGQVFSVEIANTPELRHLGLGERDSLPEDAGMLFLFDRPDTYGFWMKGMRFPIDIAWIYDGRIIHIERRVPADSVRTMYPGTPATMVLETNAGALDSINIGSEVVFQNIPSSKI
jgi:uncharacterized membrane protein (UPF0127 family)